MIIRVFIVTVLLVTMIKLSVAQQGSTDIDLSEYLEYLVSIGYDEFEIADYSEEIASLQYNKVDINSGSENELGRLFFLSSFQIKSIIEYTRKKGSIKSKYEIAYIPGFDKELAKLTSNYIIIADDQTTGYLSRKSRQLISDLIYSSRDTTHYPGSRIKTSSRLSQNIGRTSLGISIEKDQGERFLQSKHMPEFISGYMQFRSSESKPQIIVGDFRVRYGQGLNIWHGYSPGVSPTNPNLIRGSSRISPYASTDENNFFRGIAVSGKLRSTNYHVYISANMIDANKIRMPDSSIAISSLNDSGIHNSESSIARRDALTEYSAGININHNFNRINLGYSITGTRFSKIIFPGEYTENLYDFKGNSNLVMSIDHAISLSNTYIYGEAAINDKGKIAMIQGIRVHPAERVKFNLLYGYTSRAYNSFHGHIFGKETVNRFRSSLLANIDIELAENLKLSTGAISHTELWYGYRSGTFPKSKRFMTELLWSPTDLISLKMSVRHKESSSDLDIERGIEPSNIQSNNSTRLNIDIYPFDGLRLSSRIEISYIPSIGERGSLAYQGARLDMLNIPITFIARLCTYHTATYQTRIYAWEDDLLFHPSVPAFYGKGSRNYFVIDFHPKNRFSLKLKYANTQFTRNNQLERFREIRLQLRIRLSPQPT